MSINGDSRAIVEQEIAYAAEAGLSYWAFVDYWDEVRDMHLAMNRYLAAKDKKGVRYCFVEEGQRLDKVGTQGWSRLVEHFRHPDYQTVLGFDAVSAYARGGSYSMTQPSYAEQCAMIRRDRWEKCRTLRLPSITFASTGWDTPPRNERPPSWMKEVRATPDPTPPARQRPLLDSVTATPEELASHVREAIEWTAANRDLNPANTLIIYAWNEHEEGGWLQPTLGSDGRPNEERIQALGKVLRSLPFKAGTSKP